VGRLSSRFARRNALDWGYFRAVMGELGAL
jgi:hypothetical protein